MSSSCPTVLNTLSDIDCQWLTNVLGLNVTGYVPECIGAGAIGSVYRIKLQYASTSYSGPSSVVLKLAATEELSRQGGLRMGLYEAEVRFYSDIAPILQSPIVSPCYHAAFDSERGCCDILLSDHVSAATGNDIIGTTLKQAQIAMAELGRFHGSVLQRLSPELVPWTLKRRFVDSALVQSLYKKFLDLYGDQLSAEHCKIGQLFVDNWSAWVEAQEASSAVQGFIHGDYRLENMLFSTGNDDSLKLTLVDWQTCRWGPMFSDLSFFFGTSMTAEFRRVHGGDLLHIYHSEFLKTSPERILFEECVDGVCSQSFFGLAQAIVASTSLERTDRGDNLFVTMFQRSCDLILDTKALDILPKVNPPPQLSPLSTDEHLHPPGRDPLHSESWYFDVTDAAQEVGLWVRLGVTPNQPTSWYHALLCGPNFPTVAVIDFEAPHPDDSLVVQTEKYRATHEALMPLKNYQVTLNGKGKAFDDPAAILEGSDNGRSVNVKMSLEFETDGEPYLWRLATRYEIPCRVTGYFTWDEHTVTFTGARGQRDHSWGPRNWWAADWIWSAFHLDDGTHLHNCHIRPHGQKSYGVGYVQKAGTRFVELSNVRGVEDMGPNGLGGITTITMAPLPLELRIEPKGHAPLRLLAADGTVAKFPRSWASVTTNDGRKGVGWLEWNLVAK